MWYPSDNMAAFLASCDDFIDVYKQYVDEFGVNFEGIKVAASLGNLKILEYSLKKDAPHERHHIENMIIAAIVGAARTTNLHTIYWLGVKSYFKSLNTFNKTPCIIRDVAFSTHNQVFIDKCLERFKGCRALLEDIRDFNLMMRMRRLSGHPVTKCPTGGIHTDEHLKKCEQLSFGELTDLFKSAIKHSVFMKNLRFIRYFIDQCEVNYPNLRVPWKSMLLINAKVLIDLFKNRERLQADCVSCMFYNITYHRRGWQNDWIVDYDVICDLLDAGFKWHRKFQHIYKRIKLYRKGLKISKIGELIIKHQKNML